MPSPAGLPSLEALVRLFWALLDNGDRLCLDARVLRASGGSQGSALALSVLALEEASKAHDIADVDESFRQGATLFALHPDTLARWRVHRSKLSTAVSAAAFGPGGAHHLAVLVPDFEPFRAELSADEEHMRGSVEMLIHTYQAVQESAVDLNCLKQAGMYCDLQGDSLQTPAGVEPRKVAAVIAAAEALLTETRRRADSAHARFGPGPLDRSSS